MAPPTSWTWIWVNFGHWWWTGRPGVLQSMQLQRVRHDWVIELDWTELCCSALAAGKVGGSYCLCVLDLSVYFGFTYLLKCFSCVWLFITLWAVAYQAHLSTGILQARILAWIAMPSSRGYFWPGDWTHISYVSCIEGRFFTTSAIWLALLLTWIFSKIPVVLASSGYIPLTRYFIWSVIKIKKDLLSEKAISPKDMKVWTQKLMKLKRILYELLHSIHNYQRQEIGSFQKNCHR